VGVHAAQSCPELSTFFGCVNRLYNLFNASPEHCAILNEKTGCCLNRLSDTQWSVSYCCGPTSGNSSTIIKALDMLLATCSLTNEAKSEAKGLKSIFMSFKAIFLLTFWVKVLQCIDNRSLILQSGNISLDMEAAHIKALQEEIQALCNQWDALLAEASTVANEMGGTTQFHSEQRSRQEKNKTFPR
jgi:hypothetical protein